MESSTDTNTTTSSTPLSSQSPNSSSSSPPHTPTPVVISPCAACKILRRRCADKCVLAPYFPPTEPAKFTIAHRVFGASNIIKFLQELPEPQRADAVSSMVYEASARIRDPVYGCAGAICQLQTQVSELQAQLAKAQAELVNMQCQQTNLVAFILEMTQAQQGQLSPQHEALDQGFNTIGTSSSFSTSSNQSNNNSLSFLDDGNLGAMWEPLWT
ncbi:hypothetical protein UlMin_013628 [Ulmus minor]